MTLLEKAKELGLGIYQDADGEYAIGCPHTHDLDPARAGDDVCQTMANCAECYAREYKEPCTEGKAVESPAAPTIKDSGGRTKFPSGAVRDMHEGKGRFDLLPMCVLLRLAKHYEAGNKKYPPDEGGTPNWQKGIPCHSFADSAMRHLVKYMDGQNDEDHLIAAIWNLCGLAWTEEKKPELMDIPARMGL